LNTKTSPGGTFVNVAQGDSPSKACGSGQVLVHLSGGDITNVATPTGSGLSGKLDGIDSTAFLFGYQVVTANLNETRAGSP
jgi:hypothetical protein